MPHVHLLYPQTRARAGGQGHRPRRFGRVGGRGAGAGPHLHETAAETQRLAQTLETLSQQQALIQQFNDAKAALTQLERATVLSRDKLAQLRAEQQAGTGDAKALADQERLLASEVKQLERQLVSQAASHTRLHAVLTQSGLDTKNLSQEQQRLQRELAQTVAKTERLGVNLARAASGPTAFRGPSAA